MLGNPPWEACAEGDRGSGEPKGASDAAARITDFARGRRIRRRRGPFEPFQLFLERGLSLRPARRPHQAWCCRLGFVTDHGCLASPSGPRPPVGGYARVHREPGRPIPHPPWSQASPLCTSAAGETTAIRLHSGIRSADATGPSSRHRSRSGLGRRASTAHRATQTTTGHPGSRGADVEIVSRIVFGTPAPAPPDGWGGPHRVGATDDRRHFSDGSRGAGWTPRQTRPAVQSGRLLGESANRACGGSRLL